MSISQRSFVVSAGTTLAAIVGSPRLVLPWRRRYALVIRGGTVFDGLGNRGIEADVAIEGGRIVAIAKKLDDDPQYFRDTYTMTEEELTAMRERNMIKLYQLGLHPFLLVRFAGMMGILEYWQALGAPGRGGGWPRNT